MDLHADLEQRVTLNTAALPWMPSPMAGVERRMLDRRGGDAWGTTADNANNDNFRFVLERARPAEWRQRAMVQWQRTMYPGTVLGVQAGVERVRDAASVPGVGQGNAMAGVTWMWVPQ